MTSTLSDYAVKFFDADDYQPDAFAPIPVGKYRVRIEDAQEKISQHSGKHMIELTLAVSGYSAKLWAYIVLDGDTPESRKLTNQKLGSIFDSFNIPVNDFNIEDWKGRTGGAKVRHSKPDTDSDNDNIRAEVHYFLKRSVVDRLDPWQDAHSPATQAAQDNINQNMVAFSNFNDNADNQHIPF